VHWLPPLQDYIRAWCARCGAEMCDKCVSASPVDGDDDEYCKRCAQERLDEEEEEEDDEEDDEEEEEAWFNRKYPNASCLRCEAKLYGWSVVYCGGAGGACETWYCSDCFEDGTHDCPCCRFV
jgi:hypothetical protein